MSRRNKPKKGSLYLSSGRYYYKVKLPGTPKIKSYPLREPGKDKATPIRRMAIALADAMYDRAEKQLNSDAPEYDGSVATLANLFLEHRLERTADKPKHVRDKEYQFNRVTLNNFIEFLTKNEVFSLSAGDLKMNRILLWRESFQGDLCRETINKKVNVIKQMLNYAAKRELESAELACQIALIKPIKKGESGYVDHPEVRPVEWDNVLKIFSYLTPMIQDMLTVSRYTGARPGEVRVMRPCDIDRSDPDVWVYIVPDHKTERYGVVRKISLGQKAQEVLRKYLVRNQEAYCFPPPATSQGNTGPHYTSGTFARAINRAVTRYNKDHPKAKIKFHANQLRHTFGTEVCEKFGLEAARDTLGHTTTAMSRRYTKQALEKISDDNRRVAVKKLG